MSSSLEFDKISDDDAEILAQNKFHLTIGKQSQIVDLTIDREKLTIYTNINGTRRKADSVRLSDVVGCRSIPGGRSQNSAGSPGNGGDKVSNQKGKPHSKLDGNTACLQVFAYTFKKKPENGGVKSRIEMNLVPEQGETKEQNATLVERWRLIILSLLREVEFSSVDELSEALLPSPPHYLVCINPFSGKGKALQIFRQHAKHMFEEAGITFKEIITERRGHGTELAMNLDLKAYNGVIIVSGDGLLYEFINGFGQRPDREEALKLPFGILPGGSGNALCSAILDKRGLPVLKNIACHAALSIIKGKPIPKDLVQIQTPSETSLSFISIAWGLIADIDIESERFRFLGSTRFVLGTLQRILFLRKNAGRLSILPIDDESKYDHLYTNKNKKNAVLRYSTVSKQSYQQKSDVTVEGEELPSGSANQNANASTIPEGATNATRGVRANDLTLPPLTEPVPSNWTVIEGDLVCVLISYISYLSNDFICHPGRPMDEGCIMVQYMDATTTRGKLLSTLDKFKTGEYIDEEFIVTKFAKAFRLEPLSKDGILTCDGERIKFGPIQGIMSSSKCLCIS